MSSRTIWTGLLSFLLVAVSVSTAQARTFSQIGARGTGMGGAGVAQIDDENAAQWNPANMSLPSATRGYGEYSPKGFGLQTGVQVQSTNNFLKNSQDLVDFYDNNETSGIFDQSGATYDSSNRSTFIELIALARDISRDDQALLFDGTTGLNTRYDNFSISVNNISDAAIRPELDFTGGLEIPATSKVPNAFGDSGNSPTNSTYTEVANSCEESFNEGSWQVSSDFGFSTVSDKGELAAEVAGYAQDNSVDPQQTKKFCESGSEILDNSVGVTSTDNDSFDTESQRIVFEGAAINELSFSYSLEDPIAEVGNSDLYLGGGVRLMRGRVVYFEENPFNTSVADEDDETFSSDDDMETTTDFGTDLGLTFDARDDLGLSVGLVGKYLNSPSFDLPDNEDTRDNTVEARDEVEIEPQFRIGAAVYPLEYSPIDLGSGWWQLAVDYDITKNETLLSGYERQYLSVGNEFNLINSWWGSLALRAGFRENLAESVESTQYTGGLGFQLAGFNLDLAGVMSDKTTETDDGDEIPSVVGAQLNLAYRW